MSKCAAIVLAGGRGKRMNSDVAKQYLPLCGKPVLYYSLKAFQESFVEEIILVTEAGEEEYCRREILERYGFDKVRKIVAGGKERYHSVANGLDAVSAEMEYVFIQDGARPFVDRKILEDGLYCVREHNACVAAMPVKDTIKIADENGMVVSTPRRDLTWQMQTPQIFRRQLIVEAYRKLLEQETELTAAGIQITDDAMVAETLMKCPVKLYRASYENMKITTPEDLIIAASIMEKRL